MFLDVAAFFGGLDDALRGWRIYGVITSCSGRRAVDCLSSARPRTREEFVLKTIRVEMTAGEKRVCRTKPFFSLNFVQLRKNLNRLTGSFAFLEQSAFQILNDFQSPGSRSCEFRKLIPVF